MQRGDADPESLMIGSLTQSPMSGKAWKHKKSILPLSDASSAAANTNRGRGRARKRSALYNSLSFYHNKFLSLLTEEYKQEVRTGNKIPSFFKGNARGKFFPVDDTKSLIIWFTNFTKIFTQFPGRRSIE